MIAKDFSDTIWRLKGIAIFTVLFAHFIPTYTPLLTTFNVLGMMGVPTFMLCSGYFDFKSKSSLSKRLVSLLIPLSIWGTLTWCLSMIINRPPINIELLGSWFRWIVGSGSWLYFVSSLIVCLLLSKLPKADYWLPVLSVTSIVLTQLDIIPYNEYFTKYCNPLNFALYFSAGRWIRKFMDDKIIEVTPLLLCSALVLFGVSVPIAENYFCLGGVGVGISSAVILLWIASKWKWNIWKKAGALSFVIYFIHMQLGGMLNTRMTFLLGHWYEPLKIIVIFAVVFFIAEGLRIILDKLSQDKLLRCLGYR